MPTLPLLRKRILYGRRRDIAVLRERVRSAGLTVVTGRPRAGKSWLLERTAYDLWSGQKAEVGYYDCTTNADEALRESLGNLVDRLIQEADFSRRLELLIQNSGTAHPVSGIFEGLLRGVQRMSGYIPVPGVNEVAATLEGLSKKLRGEGFVTQRQTLEYDWARDTVRLIYETNKAQGQAEKPIVLFLDGWERSRDIEASANLLRGFLNRIEDWNGCHIIIGCRDPEEDHYRSTTEKANQLLQSLVQQFVDASAHRLDFIELDDHESRKLLTFLREIYPKLGDIDDAWILEQIGGCPAVIGEWDKRSRLPDTPRPATREWLAEIAADARQNLYPELANLAKLEDEAQRTAAFRLAFLPDLHQSPELRKVAFDGVDEDNVIDALVEQGILEPLAHTEPNPLLGHETRRQAARQAFLGIQGKSPTRWTVKAIEALAILLASEIRAVDASAVAFSNALLALTSHVASITPSETITWLFAANFTLFRGEAGGRFAQTFDAQKFRIAAKQLCPLCGPVLAMGLFNAFNDAETDSRREELLGELRDLQQAYPDDSAVREQLAMGLFNAFNDAETDSRREELLGELRDLQQAYPDDSAVRERLAKGLFNAFNGAETDLRREELLGKLRDLQQAYPDDSAVREWLAKGLFNAFNKAETDSRREELLGKLRDLQQAYLDDSAVRELLAKGLFNAFYDAETDSRREELGKKLFAFLDTCQNDPWMPGFLRKLGQLTGTASR